MSFGPLVLRMEGVAAGAPEEEGGGRKSLTRSTAEDGRRAFLVVKGGSRYSGLVRVAAGRLVFASEGANLSLPVHGIYRMVTDQQKLLEILCANCKYFFFSFPGGSARAVLEAVEREQALGLLVSLPRTAGSSPGWHFYRHEEEYVRVFGPLLGTSGSQYRITDANAQFQLCPSYPFLLVVPSSCSDDVLRGCARYRSSGRFPALTWRNSANGATLSRCAQPLIGMSGLGGGGRSSADEQVIDSLRTSGSSRTPQVLFIVDARPLLNAQANKMTGGGTENMAWYPGCTLEQLDLVNIHKVRDAFDAMQLLCANACKTEAGYTDGLPGQGDDGRWLAALHESRWVGYVTAILKGAMRVASLLRDGNPVMIHCSDGWDRTPQVSSLAQIVLDPYYRTRHGLATLICKEWLSFGHRFATRTGFSTRDSKEYCPVFLQWIDCLFQIARRFPSAFDFNASFLVALVDQLYAGDAATFGCDTEQEVLLRLFAHDGSASVWDRLLAPEAATKFSNPGYKPTTAHLFFRPYSWNVRLFDALFLRSL